MHTALGLSESATRRVVSAAGMAPSLFNIQPWRLRLCPDRIEVHPDLGRRLIAHDPEDRELRIACGAALFNLRLALHAHGVTPVATIQPDEAPDVQAIVRRGPASAQSRDDAALYLAIGRRRTNRQPFLDAPVPEVYRRLLVHAAATEGADLRTITAPAERFELRCIIAAADQRQRDDVVCRAELEAWTGDRHGHPDGVPLASAGPKPEPQDLWAYRDMGNGFARVRAPGGDFEAEPFVVVLSTGLDGPGRQVQAGQALQRVLLTATALGLTASFLSQPIEVPEERRELRRLLADGRHPQAVLRVGFGAPVTATPRLDVADLLLGESVVPAQRPTRNLSGKHLSSKGQDMIRIPAALERRRRDGMTQPSASDRPPTAGVEGSSVPVSAAPAAGSGATSATPRIVVGVDGSPASVDALRWAARQARLTGAAVQAVISWDYPSGYGLEFGSLDTDWADNAQDTLDDALQVALGDDASTVTGTVTRGHPAEVLVAAAHGADLLVVGSRGHATLAGMLLGSVSEHVAARARCPVVVVRHIPAPPPPAPPPQIGEPGRETVSGADFR